MRKFFFLTTTSSCQTFCFASVSFLSALWFSLLSHSIESMSSKAVHPHLEFAVDEAFNIVSSNAQWHCGQILIDGAGIGTQTFC